MLNPFRIVRLRFPGTPGYSRNKRIQPLRWEIERSTLFRTHVRGHQGLNDFDAVVECQHRRFLAKEDPHEVPILGLVAS